MKKVVAGRISIYAHGGALVAQRMYYSFGHRKQIISEWVDRYSKKCSHIQITPYVNIVDDDIPESLPQSPPIPIIIKETKIKPQKLIAEEKPKFTRPKAEYDNRRFIYDEIALCYMGASNKCV